MQTLKSLTLRDNPDFYIQSYDIKYLEQCAEYEVGDILDWDYDDDDGLFGYIIVGCGHGRSKRRVAEICDVDVQSN